MSNNPYGIDALYDEDIYQDFVDKPKEELERIIDEIDTEETKYLDKEAEQDHLWDKLNRTQTEISELKAKQTKRESNTRAKEIIKLNEDMTKLNADRENISKELEDAKRERRELDQIKHIVETYILSGKYPVHKKVKTTTEERSIYTF